MLRKVDTLQKFRSLRNKVFACIMNISSFSSKSGIQYLEQGEISICKVLVLIKVVPGERMIISFIENLNCIDSK